MLQYHDILLIFISRGMLVRVNTLPLGNNSLIERFGFLYAYNVHILTTFEKSLTQQQTGKMMTHCLCRVWVESIVHLAFAQCRGVDEDRFCGRSGRYHAGRAEGGGGGGLVRLQPSWNTMQSCFLTLLASWLARIVLYYMLIMWLILSSSLTLLSLTLSTGPITILLPPPLLPSLSCFYFRWASS